MATGSVLKETLAVFVTISISVQNRHSRIVLRGSSTRQSVRNASRTGSPGGRSPSGRISRLLCKDYFKGTCTTPFCEKWHPAECLFYKSETGCRFGEKCSYAHHQVEEQPSKRSKKKKVLKVQWLCWKVHDNWVAYFRIWNRRSLHRFCRRAQTYGNQSDVFNSQKPCFVMKTFETKIHRLEWIAQVIFISVTQYHCYTYHWTSGQKPHLTQYGQRIECKI